MSPLDWNMDRRRQEELDKVAPLLGSTVMEVAALELLLVELWSDLRLLHPNAGGPEAVPGDKDKLGERAVKRIQKMLDNRLSDGLREGLERLCLDSLDLLSRRNRYVHDPWTWAIDPAKETHERARPQLLQLLLDHGHHPPWTEENQPWWRAVSVADLAALRQVTRQVRDEARELLWQCQEEVAQILHVR